MVNTLPINLNHPRIKARTSEQQKYRDELANNLKADRALGEVGKLLAEDRIKQAQKSEEYIVEKYGFTKQWVNAFIEAGRWEFVANNLDKFEWLDGNEIANKLIKVGEWKAVAENLDKFEWLDQKTAEILIKASYWRAVVNNLNKFKRIDYNEIANSLIKTRYWRSLAENLDKFKDLDQEIAKMLIQIGYVEEVRKNIKSFKQSEV